MKTITEWVFKWADTLLGEVTFFSIVPAKTALWNNKTGTSGVWKPLQTTTWENARPLKPGMCQTRFWPEYVDPPYLRGISTKAHSGHLKPWRVTKSQSTSSTLPEMWRQLLHLQMQHTSNFYISQFKTYSWLSATRFRGSFADVFVRVQCFLAYRAACWNTSSALVFHLQM